jgi:hypothetical protein
MKIETEFNIEDTVYVMMFNDIYKTEVVKIEVHVDEDNASTKYWLSAGDMWHKDKDLFRTKESLITDWLEKNKVDDQ